MQTSPPKKAALAIEPRCGARSRAPGGVHILTPETGDDHVAKPQIQLERRRVGDREPPALPTMSRSDANKLLKQRAQDLYHEARAEREERFRQFEAEFGRADRIDHTLLRDLPRLQTRFAAIAARQFKYAGDDDEPKVSKFIKQLGKIIGELGSRLATEHAFELFAPVEDETSSGPAARSAARASMIDPSQLQRHRRSARPEERDADADLPGADEVCLHGEEEPYEEDPSRGACAECGEGSTSQAPAAPRIRDDEPGGRGAEPRPPRRH